MNLKFLLFGGNGWIGQQLTELLQQAGHNVILSKIRAHNFADVEQEIILVKPDRVISVIGRTHGPGLMSIDYLQQPGKLSENIQDNLYGTLTIAHICNRHSIHLTSFGTGCIYEYNDQHPFQSMIGFKEDDEPNFYGSDYSTVKAYVDRILREQYSDKVLNIRIRMPITANFHPRNFITKITKYQKVCSIPNSMTVLPSILPLVIKLAVSAKTGPYNCTNPGIISHDQILELYQQIVDPYFTWKNFTIDEQDKVLLARRSNNYLDTTKLEKEFPAVQNIHDAVVDVLKEMATLKQND